MIIPSIINYQTSTIEDRTHNICRRSKIEFWSLAACSKFLQLSPIADSTPLWLHTRVAFARGLTISQQCRTIAAATRMMPLLQFGRFGRRRQAQNACAYDALFVRLLGLVGCGNLAELTLAHGIVHVSQVCLGFGNRQRGHIAVVWVRIRHCRRRARGDASVCVCVCARDRVCLCVFFWGGMRLTG